MQKHDIYHFSSLEQSLRDIQVGQQKNEIRVQKTEILTGTILTRNDQIQISTEPFLTISALFESPHSSLSNRAKIDKNNSVEIC